MIDFYLDFSRDRIGKFLDFLNLRTSELKKSMMTASIFGINFFCLYELVFNSTQTISGVSIIGGVIVFAAISIYLARRRQSKSISESGNHRALDIFFKVHVAATLLIYLFISFSSSF